MELSTGVRSLNDPGAPALIKFCTAAALRADPIIRELDKTSDGLITRVYENREFTDFKGKKWIPRYKKY